MALLLAHAILLSLASYASARRLVLDLPGRLLAAFVLGWTNIIVTSLLLSSLGLLGEPGWFFRTSLLLAGGLWLALRRLPLPPGTLAENAPATAEDRRALLVFALTLAPIAYAAIRIAATYEPNNYDSLTYHLPRVMFYLGQGDLSHFDTGNDRQIYFPFNFNLLQLAVLIYDPPVQAVNFVNLLTWAVAGIAIHRFCRLVKIGRVAALAGTWLALTSTQVLAQATATTNDLPTGAGLLCTLVFVLLWMESKLHRHALLAGLAAGLAVGSKLTVIFFGPAAALIVLTLLVRQWRARRMREFFAGVRAWIAPSIAALLLAAPFALVNLAEKGQWINKTYDFTLNRPFSFASVVQTSQAYLVQMFLEPLHRFTFDLKVTAELNAWGTRTFFPNWNEAYAFSPLFLFPPDLNEDHVWFGFTGPVILLAGVFCLLRWRRIQTPVAWAAALGMGWFATYFLLNKWSLYNQRYFVQAILVLSPCLALAIERAAAHRLLGRGWRAAVITLGALSLWLAGIYLFKNTSRPYAPLWAGTPPPPALPALPPTMVQRLSGEPKINIDSTDGNERIFLLMDLGRQQRFTARATTQPDAYNVYSEWGFPRKVAYSNIEQLSSYTTVEVPAKRTAGVEFLGTIGRGQPSIDYYGLPPRPETLPAQAHNRNIFVELSYGPREPRRYERLGIKVAGLNEPDHARLVVGVDYANDTSEELASFEVTGEARASVLRPIKAFTVRVHDRTTGELMGSVDIPYLFRDQPPEFESPHDPMSLFSAQLVSTEPSAAVQTQGLAAPEGPYPQWDLPVIRWAKAPVLRLVLPESKDLARISLNFDLCLHARDGADIDIVLNGKVVKHYRWEGPTRWLIQTLDLAAQPGVNVIEFRNVRVGRKQDWLDYLERYPDVKAHLVSEGIALEEGARWHFESHGQREGRQVFTERETESLPGDGALYYLFRNLRVDGYRKR